jgi:hypothetical protein
MDGSAKKKHFPFDFSISLTIQLNCSFKEQSFLYRTVIYFIFKDELQHSKMKFLISRIDIHRSLSLLSLDEREISFTLISDIKSNAQLLAFSLLRRKRISFLSFLFKVKSFDMLERKSKS